MRSQEVQQPIPSTASLALYQRYTRESDGGTVPQSSSPQIIERLLATGEFRPAQSVLEIGTGSGYSTARIAALVGPHGRVVSVDVEHHLVERAEALLRADGLTQVRLLCRDGRTGAPEHAPFDRVIVWANAGTVPHCWVEQTKSNGLLIVPVLLAPLVLATAVARLRRARDGSIHAESLESGGFVPMHGPGRTSWPGPGEDAALIWDNGESWLSAPWIDATEGPNRQKLMQQLADAPAAASLLRQGEDAEGLAAYLLCRHLDDCLTGARQGIGPTIGLRSGTGSMAFQALYRPASLATGADAVRLLRGAIRSWREAGSPGLPQLGGLATRQGDEWSITLTQAQDG